MSRSWAAAGRMAATRQIRHRATTLNPVFGIYFPLLAISQAGRRGRLDTAEQSRVIRSL
jgi:hypothetical protein